MDSISCKECKKCLFINTLQLIIQSSTKYKSMKKKILLGLVLIFRLMDMGLVVDNLKHM